MNFKLEHSHAKPRFFASIAITNEVQIDSKITYEFEGADLKSVLERLECFLRGTGFVFSGELGIVNENEE
jgi:hypothetical protein